MQSRNTARVRKTGGPNRSIFFAAALATVLGLSVANPASADDGMSDLKSENQELQRRIQALSQELQILKKIVVQNQQAVSAAMTNSATPMNIVTSGKKDVSLSISGQVNRMALYADDGDEARWFHADNDNSSTRIRFKGKAKLDEEWSAGTNIEVQFESNSSADVTIDQNAAVIDSDSFTERKLELFFYNKRFGKLSFGQGDTASNGTAETDLSGTSVASKSELAALGKEISFTLSGTPGTSSGTDVGDMFSNHDGLSRDDRLRYDSPSFSGAKLSTSWVDGDEWDVALRYGRNFDGVEVALAGSYWDAGPTGQFDGFSTSGSVLLPFGTSLTLAYATRNSETVGRDDEGFVYAKLGHQFKATDLGKTAVSIDYAKTSDQRVNNDEGTAVSLAAVQKIDRLGSELYGFLRQYDADIPNVSTEKIMVGGFGARVKF